jgi:hypothetical protein
MASAQLFFKGNRDYGVGTITFDLLLTESHSFSNTITDHNVEDGSIITDHIKNNLESGGVTGIISNFTIKQNALISNRAQDAYDELKRLWKSRELVTVITVMEVYEDVAITDVSIDRSSDTGEAITLNISFRKVKKVTLQEIVIFAGVNPKDMSVNQNRQIANSSDNGRQTTKDVDFSDIEFNVEVQ